MDESRLDISRIEGSSRNEKVENISIRNDSYSNRIKINRAGTTDI